jgi:two-component system sensor histidine kinase/response regulator
MKTKEDFTKIEQSSTTVLELESIIKKLESEKATAMLSNQAKSAFISNMSHEIRTPMNSIIGYAHLLETLSLTEEQKDYVNRINEASKHLLSIVNDILDLSKIEAGKMIIENLPFRLDRLLNQVKTIFESALKEKRLYLDIETINTPNYLIGDENRIRQILINLMSNAIKFTETGGISLVCFTETESSNHPQLNFKVKDTGIGMTPKQVKKLFKDYEQADQTTSRLYGGTGLGLSISKKLATLMQGDIFVKSNLNDGSEFVLTLPLVVSKDNLEETDISVHQKPKMGSKVLLAEDNLLNQKLGERILSNMGMNVTLASNGSIALDLARNKVFDVIILDLQMPIMDGIEACRNIRIFNQKTPIIAMTGSTYSEDREMCYQAGMNDYISKPIDPISLYKALIKWVPDTNQ